MIYFHVLLQMWPGIKVPVTVVSGNVDFQFASIDGLRRTDLVGQA